MTLVIAAQGKDFVVLGTDTRGKLEAQGSRVEVNNLAQKLIPVSSHAAILIFGSAGSAQYLAHLFQSKNTRAGINVSTLIKDFAELCRREWRKLKDVPLDGAPLPRFGFIVAGLDQSGETFSVPKCYGLGSSTGFFPEFYGEGFNIKGKQMIARFLFAKTYKKEEVIVNNLCKLVAQALYDTSKVDGDVGGKFNMAIIESRGFRVISDTDISELIADKWADSY